MFWSNVKKQSFSLGFPMRIKYATPSSRAQSSLTTRPWKQLNGSQNQSPSVSTRSSAVLWSLQSLKAFCKVFNSRVGRPDWWRHSPCHNSSSLSDRDLVITGERFYICVRFIGWTKNEEHLRRISFMHEILSHFQWACWILIASPTCTLAKN